MNGVSKITVTDDVALLTFHNIPNDWKILSQIFTGLADAQVNLDMISQTAPQGHQIDLSFTLRAGQLVEVLGLINRFKETRRKHPLADRFKGSLDQAVRVERSVLKTVRENADFVIDTSLLSPAQLKKQISTLFLGNASDALMIHCVSFGFKYGAPTEADLIFDVRCLPNPYYIEELKRLTGLDAPVREYVMKWEQSQEVQRRLFSLLDYMVPLYSDEGKSQLVVAMGCTGGKHRSVTFAQLLYEHFIAKGMRASVNHRDIQKH